MTSRFFRTITVLVFVGLVVSCSQPLQEDSDEAMSRSGYVNGSSPFTIPGKVVMVPAVPGVRAEQQYSVDVMTPGNYELIIKYSAVGTGYMGNNINIIFPSGGFIGRDINLSDTQGSGNFAWQTLNMGYIGTSGVQSMNLYIDSNIIIESIKFIPEGSFLTNQFNAGDMTAGSGVSIVEGWHWKAVCFDSANAWVSADVDFGSAKGDTISLEALNPVYGSIVQFHLDSPDGPVFATVYPRGGDCWYTSSNECYPKPTGFHTVYMTCSDPGIQVKWFKINQ
jgi:hypothetical protein